MNGFLIDSKSFTKSYTNIWYQIPNKQLLGERIFEGNSVTVDKQAILGAAFGNAFNAYTCILFKFCLRKK